MKRYYIDGSCECGRIDDAEAFEDENGEWIKYEDYEKEKANGIKPLLCDVLADIRGKAMFADSSTIEIDDIVLEEILSKYFA